MLRKGTRFSKGYATVVEDEGINYREIAEIMTDLGFSMNHSSARNYVLRVMHKFASAFDDKWRLGLDEDRIKSLAGSPQFQSAIADLLHGVDMDERHS